MDKKPKVGALVHPPCRVAGYSPNGQLILNTVVKGKVNRLYGLHWTQVVLPAQLPAPPTVAEVVYAAVEVGERRAA